MIPKDKKLSSVLVKKAFKYGKSVFGSDISFIFISSPDDAASRFGVSVSSKAADTAVRRNSARRKSYRALGSVISHIERPVMGVFVIKKDISPLTDSEVAERMRDLLSKAGFLASKS